MYLHWHRVPGEEVDTPTLEIFKAWLDEAWNNLDWWKVSLPIGRGVEQEGL